MNYHPKLKNFSNLHKLSKSILNNKDNSLNSFRKGNQNFSSINEKLKIKSTKNSPNNNHIVYNLFDNPFLNRINKIKHGSLGSFLNSNSNLIHFESILNNHKMTYN